MWSYNVIFYYLGLIKTEIKIEKKVKIKCSSPLLKHSWIFVSWEILKFKQFSAVILWSVFTQKHPLLHDTHASRAERYIVLSGLLCLKGTVSTYLIPT